MQVNQTAYHFYTTYVWDYGLEEMPVAGPPGTPCEIIQSHAPMCRKIVCWVAQADEGADPQAPDWNTGTANEQLTRKAISSTFLSVRADGGTANTIAGIYEYILSIPPSDTDPLPMGGPPWDSSLANLVYPSTFMQLLNQPSPTNPTGQGTYAGMQGGGLIQKPLGGD